jgi:NAD(P)-dependent dehydrogenase (short-subunit alcohol dehydrogenase family)
VRNVTPQSEFARRIAIANVDVAIAAEQVRQAMERLQRATAQLELLEHEAGILGAIADASEPVEETPPPALAETSRTEEAPSHVSAQEPRDASSDRLTIVHGPDVEPAADDAEDDDVEIDWLRRPEDDPRNVLRELANLVF